MWRADGKWCLILLHSVFSPYGQVIKLQLADSDYLVSRPTLTSWLHRVAQTRKCTMYTGLRSVNFIVSNLFAGDGSGVENYSNLFYTHLATYLPLILLWQPISKSYSRRHPYYPWFSFLIMLCSNDIKETTIQLLENILYIFPFLFRDHHVQCPLSFLVIFIW